MEKNTINILGVNISALKKREILEKIEQFLADGQSHQIATPNPEFILTALKDEEFFYILNNADLAIPDGVGLKFAAWAMGKKLRIFTGADLAKEILKMAEEKNLKVGIVSWDKGLSSADDIERAVKKDYPELQFLAADISRELRITNYELRIIIDFKPDILFCSLGAPYQEKLIFHILTPSPSPIQERGVLLSVKIAIGIGGAFDFLTGKTKRAPRIMRLLGLEWFWRLITQKVQPPLSRFSRIKRIIYNALILFPYKFIKWRFILPFLYRPNVACILFKREGKEYKILLVKRSDQENHWQLPQGGTDGENIKTAGERELSEEIGTDKFKVVAVYKNLYKYTFAGLEKHGVDLKTIQNKLDRNGYKGQKQSLIIAEFLGDDEDIKINFWDHDDWKWISAENLINEVHPVRKEAAEIFLEKFNRVTHNS